MKINNFLIAAVVCFCLYQNSYSQEINFSAKNDFPTGGNPRVIAIGDFNDDGKLDMVSANYGANTISVLLNTSPAGSVPGFTSKADFATGPHPASVVIADVNNDGKPDIITVNVDDSTVSVFMNSTEPGASTPSFSNKIDFHSGKSPVSVAVADINGDGKPDIITSNFGANTISILINETQSGAMDPVFSAKNDFNTGIGPYFVTTGDVNGDGMPDIIIANDNNKDSTISVLLNTTETNASIPTFSAKNDFYAGITPVSVALADLNGDGKPDIVAVSSIDSAISILLNITSSGALVPAFSAKSDFNMGSQSFYVAADDLNNDGKPDIVTANIYANTISVFMNTTSLNASSITFSPKLDFKTGTNPASVVIADINNDGKPDIVTANYMGNSVSVLYDSSTHPPVSLFDDLAAMYIQNSTSESVLSVQSIGYGSTVSLETEAEEYENEWFVVQDVNYPSYYRLKNLYSSKVISDSSDETIVVKGEADNDNQRWRMTNTGTNEWEIENVKTGKYLTLKNNTLSLTALDSSASQKWQIKMVNPDYAVPVPKQVNTGRYLVGAEMSNLWDVSTRPNCWNEIAPYPDRRPVTGFYKEGSPEVMDWDIKMAVDNGISFFLDCWFRTESSVGKHDVTAIYDHWINGLAQAKYKSQIKFMIMWITLDFPGISGGIKDKEDFLNNLVPYWISHLFKNPNYLTIDNKPVISFFYSPSFINECGGQDSAKDAITKFRQMVKDAGFADLIILGQWCTDDYITHDNSDWKYIGADYSNAYHWPSYVSGAFPVKSNSGYYSDEQSITVEEYCWKGQDEHSVLPKFVTCSMGYDDSPWGGKMKYFRLTPDNYATLLDDAKNLIDKRDQNSLESKLIFLDSWNEMQEGHYIYPTEQYGFGYLNSVKQIFGNITFVKKKDSDLLCTYSLLQNYPNPFNPITEIKYSIPKGGMVILKVYNVLGREVSSLVNQEQKPGSYTINFKASGLASGVYLYRLRSGDLSLARKMILLK
ncbi:MAG: FG-GAP-like repeat-containing protein [Ignavibacteriaceae bacterium]|nr:FG-GAP-like repeat-containing protein [Ignavibacteriaceae bacterium]